MTIHASDLLTPKGRLKAKVLWPGVDLSEVSENLEEFLTEGYAKAGTSAKKDDAAKWWAYYRAWDEKYQTLSASPATASIGDEGSRGYTQSQIDSWRIRADEALTEFNSLVPAVESVLPPVRMSRAMAVDFTW